MDFFDFLNFRDSRIGFFDFHDFHDSLMDFFVFYDFHDSHMVVRRENELWVRVPPPPSVEPVVSRGAQNTNG